MRSCPLGSLTRCLCVAACWILLAREAQAFDSDKLLTGHTHTVWTRKDGLPSAFIDSIAESQDGYLWLSTTDALVRFDGVRFVHWRAKTGYKGLLALCVLCARRAMEVSGSGLPPAWSATFAAMT